MRSFDERAGRALLALGLASALAACGSKGSASLASAPGFSDITGPAADYPVVIGDPYTVLGVTYEPRDVLNYDEVGYLSLDTTGGNTVSGEHHTLPLPSYVEVTSLDSGRTILVRLERRGPMTGSFLIGLSLGAANQLGVTAGAPVRVRRVNPPEQERALLRGGAEAPLRMDTPVSLVNALRRRLPNGEGPLGEAGETALAPATLPASTPIDGAPGEPSLAPPPVEEIDLPPSSVALGVVAEAPPESPVAAPATPTAGGFVVQAGAFSIRENADRVANSIDGAISQSGRLYLVRTGPFATRSEAEASLAKVRAAGYSDARILNGS